MLSPFGKSVAAHSNAALPPAVPVSARSMSSPSDTFWAATASIAFAATVSTEFENSLVIPAVVSEIVAER